MTARNHAADHAPNRKAPATGRFIKTTALGGVVV